MANELSNFNLNGTNIEVVDSTARRMIQEILLEFHPVGSIYLSVNNTSPAELFGGTWERIQDRFLLSAGSSYSAGSTGGSADAVNVSHSHTFTGTAVTSGNNSVEHTHSIPALSGTTNTSGGWTIINTALGSRTGKTANLSSGTTRIVSSSSGDSYVIANNSNTTAKTLNDTLQDPGHLHTVTTKASTTGSNSASHTHSVTAKGSISAEGVSGTGKNMPPYLAVYVWKRTA